MSGWLMSKTSKSLGVAMVVVGGLTMGGCSGGGEERSLIRNFFTASRVNDRATLGNIAMVGFNPQEDGTVGSFDVENITEEQRRPLRMRELTTAVTQAQQNQQEFAGRMKAYQDENLDAILLDHFF